MGAPFASIGGIASGLDTAGIVQSLMQLERQPMVALQQRQVAARQANEAWGQILSRLSSVRTTTDRLTDPAWLAGTLAVSSSNEAAVRLGPVSGASPGSVSFEVVALASAHQVTIGGSFAGSGQAVGAGTLRLAQVDGTVHEVTLGASATLEDAARALDDLDGISARVLRVSESDHRLVVTAMEAGQAASFDLSSSSSDVAGIQLTQVQQLAEGRDAHLRLGELDLFRDSNTVTDLYDGVELRLVGTGTVTVDVRQDLGRATADVAAFVDSVNALLAQLQGVGRTSADAAQRGPLAGDALVRELSLAVRGALSQVQAQDGTFATLGEIGLGLTRDGRVTLDEAKLRDALAMDQASVVGLLGRASGASDPGVEVLGAGRAPAGSYALQLDTAARVAAITGAVYSPPSGSPKTFTITTATGTVQVDIAEDADLTVALARINQALVLAGVTTLVAREDAGRVRLEGLRAGSADGFTVAGSGAWALDGEHVGTSAAGSLSDGEATWAFVASGRTVTLTDPSVRSLSFRVPLDTVGPLGTVTVGDGLGGVLDRILRAAEGSDGSIARARGALDGRIRATDSSIEAFEQRLEIRERTIRRQFTAMESALARFNAQASWLASQLGAMSQ